MKDQFNTMQSTLEKFIIGLSKTTDHQQFNTVVRSLFSSGALKVAEPE